MARSKRVHTPPTPQQAARFGIDSLSFTIPKVLVPSCQTENNVMNDDARWLQKIIQQYISRTVTFDDLKPELPNGLYAQVFSLSARVEDPKEKSKFNGDYKGKSAILLRISCNPRPASDGKLYENDTTSFQLHGELLKRIDYLPILRWILEQGGKVTKIDLFKDDYDGFLRQKQIHDLSTVSAWQDHINSRLVRSSGDIYNADNCSYYGNPKTIQVCIYNKAVEDQEKFKHIRAELRLRKVRDTATGFVRQLVEDPSRECELISSLLGTYIKFLPKYATNRYHKNKTAPYEWWTRFLGATSPIKIKDITVPTSSPRRTSLEHLTVEQLRTRRNKLLKKQALLQENLMAVEWAIENRAVPNSWAHL
jgi:hypothetical protein